MFNTGNKKWQENDNQCNGRGDNKERRDGGEKRTFFGRTR